MLSLYTYIENVFTFEDPIEEFAKIAGEEISPQASEDIMTIAEQLINRGIKQGIEQGVEKNSVEIALRMIEEGSDPAFIMKVTQLPLDKIKELQANRSGK